MNNIPDELKTQEDSTTETSSDNTTPLRCFSSAFLSGGFAYLCYSMFTSIVNTYAGKVITSTNPIVINITTAVRTLVMGIVALATGVFTMVAIGLFLLGIQVTIQKLKKAETT